MYVLRAAICVMALLFAITCNTDDEKNSDAAVIAFAKTVEKEMADGNGSFLDKAINIDEFEKRMDLPENSAAAAYIKGLRLQMSLGTQIIKGKSDKETFTFIKHYKKNNAHHIVFRFASSSEIYNYYDFELLKKYGNYEVADMYDYGSGDLYSLTMASLFYTFYSKAYENHGNGLSERSVDNLNSLYTKAESLSDQGKNVEAKATFDQLPEYIRNTKTGLLFAVRICGGISNEEYTAAIDRYLAKFPFEQNVDFIMMHVHFIRKDYNKAINAINAVDSQINKDPMLDYYRYHCYNMMNDTAKVINSLQSLLKGMPDFQEGFLEFIAKDLQLQKKQQADSLINIYRKKPAFDQTRLSEIISYYQ